MLLCRILSIFFLLHSLTFGSIAAKNVSQADIGPNDKRICKFGNKPNVESDLDELLDDTDNALAFSSEAFESNGTLSDDSIFDDDRFGHVIEKFINEMEVFWIGVKALVADENKKSQQGGNWWHGDIERKYNQMKGKFYENVPKELPQKVKDVIDEYEMRYNDLMWSEIENMILKQGIQANSVPEGEQSCTIRKNVNAQNNKDIKDSMDNKCKKRSFEDVFQVKLTKSSSFSAIKCDD